MSKRKRFRWVCPQCGGTTLAGARPRALATSRFCLDCSAGSTELVARTCPTLDKKREAKAAKAQARKKRVVTARVKRKTQAKVAQSAEAVAKNFYGEFDLREETPKLLAVARQDGYPVRRPRMTLRWRHKGDHTSGYAYFYENRICLTIPKGSPAAPALALLAHELAHKATPDDGGHGEEWRYVFKRMVEEVYDTAVGHLSGRSSQVLHVACTKAIARVLGETLTPAQLESEEGEE